MIDCTKPEKARSLLAFRDCLDCSEANCNLRSGRIPLTFRTSASVRAWRSALCLQLASTLAPNMGRSPVAHTKCWQSTRLALRVGCINYLINFSQKHPLDSKFINFETLNIWKWNPPPLFKHFSNQMQLSARINITNCANLTECNGWLALSFNFSLSWKEQCTISNAMQCELKRICNVHEHVARASGWANWAEKCAMSTI